MPPSCSDRISHTKTHLYTPFTYLIKIIKDFQIFSVRMI